MLRSRHAHRVAVLTVAVSLAALAGCSGGRAGVSGKVAYDGKPVDGGVIVFVPEGDAAGTKVSGDIVGGEYKLPADRGPKPGKYKVEIIWKQKKPSAKKTDPDVVTPDQTIQVIPPKYNTQTTLNADVKSGSNELNFDLPK